MRCDQLLSSVRQATAVKSEAEKTGVNGRPPGEPTAIYQAIVVGVVATGATNPGES
jgi:hypothetical protein